MILRKRKTIASALVVLCLTLFATLLLAQSKPKYSPSNDLVPDEETAIKIAEAILTPIYGSDVVEREKPFRVHLVKGAWIVDGAIRHEPGGNLHIEIRKKDCRIVRVIATE